MGGGGGQNTIVWSQTPEVMDNVAPQRTSAEAMPENADKPLFSSGSRLTAEERDKKTKGSSRLVIPLEESASSGGYTPPREPTGVV